MNIGLSDEDWVMNIYEDNCGRGNDEGKRKEKTIFCFVF
jgi:hypothetical protein